MPLTWLTVDTREDIPAEAQRSAQGVWLIWMRFLLLAAVVAVAGWVVDVSGIVLVRHTGLSETLVGSLFTAVATSLPELVTTIAAVLVFYLAGLATLVTLSDERRLPLREIAELIESNC